MKLDRNINGNGTGKYALVKLRAQPENDAASLAVARALSVLDQNGMLDYGMSPKTEFFVIRLKDRYAKAALRGYFNAIEADEEGDMEYAAEIDEMQMRAGPDNPFCKKPD